MTMSSYVIDLHNTQHALQQLINVSILNGRLKKELYNGSNLAQTSYVLITRHKKLIMNNL